MALRAARPFAEIESARDGAEPYGRHCVAVGCWAPLSWRPLGLSAC